MSGESWVMDLPQDVVKSVMSHVDINSIMPNARPFASSALRVNRDSRDVIARKINEAADDSAVAERMRLNRYLSASNRENYQRQYHIEMLGKPPLPLSKTLPGDVVHFYPRNNDDISEGTVVRVNRDGTARVAITPLHLQPQEPAQTTVSDANVLQVSLRKYRDNAVYIDEAPPKGSKILARQRSTGQRRKSAKPRAKPPARKHSRKATVPRKKSR